MIITKNHIEAARLFTPKNNSYTAFDSSYLINGKLITTNGRAMLVQQVGGDISGVKIDINVLSKNRDLEITSDFLIEDLSGYVGRFNRVIPENITGEISNIPSDILIKVDKVAKYLKVQKPRIQHNGNDNCIAQYSDGSFIVISPLKYHNELGAYIKPKI